MPLRVWNTASASHLFRRAAYGATPSELSAARPYRNNVRVWLTRMIYTARPLEERMTFFWHSHFATNDMKVADPIMVRNQVELFRRYALGNFRTLAKEVARDPAMLI